MDERRRSCSNPTKVRVELDSVPYVHGRTIPAGEEPIIAFVPLGKL